MVEGQWIFGLIARDGGGFRLEIYLINQQNADTLISLIKKHVELGSTNISDSWAANARLIEHSNVNGTVIHEEIY